MIRAYQIRCTTAGSAGSATVTAYSEEVIQGIVTAVKVDYNTPITTTTVVITEDGGMQQSILSVGAGAVTDIIRYPTAPAYTQANAAVSGVVVPIMLAGSKVKVVVALSDALTDAVIVTIYTLS